MTDEQLLHLAQEWCKGMKTPDSVPFLQGFGRYLVRLLQRQPIPPAGLGTPGSSSVSPDLSTPSVSGVSPGVQASPCPSTPQRRSLEANLEQAEGYKRKLIGELQVTGKDIYEMKKVLKELPETNILVFKRRSNETDSWR